MRPLFVKLPFQAYAFSVHPFVVFFLWFLSVDQSAGSNLLNNNKVYLQTHMFT